jgi:predicted DNA-binding transcriptional regulator AlpA
MPKTLTTRMTLHRKVKAGEFPPPFYIGSRKFWFEDQIDSYLNELR